jgi:magnesium-transporting ATPase (P-type)
MFIVAILSLMFAVIRGDALFAPVHFLVLLYTEIMIHEFLFRAVITVGDVSINYIDDEEWINLKSKTMMYHIIYTIAVPTFICLFNLFPGGSYYLSVENVKLQKESGIPELNSFIFVFVLLARMFSVLSFRTKDTSSWKIVSQRYEVILIVGFIGGVISVSCFFLPLGTFFQIKPLTIFQAITYFPTHTYDSLPVTLLPKHFT